MRTSAVALLLALVMAAPVFGYTTGAGTCPPSYDLGSNAWADGPHTTNTGGVSRWTIDRLASAGRIIVTIGGFEDEAGFFGTVQPALPGQSASGFALHFDDGRQVMSLENLVSFIEAVKARVPAGHARPLFFTDVRHDLLTQHDVMAAGVQRPSASWFLKSSRPLSTLAFALRGPGLIAQTHADCDLEPGGANDGLACGLTMCRNFDPSTVTAGELYGEANLGTGCGRVYDGTGNRSRGVTLPELIDGIEPGLGDRVAYYKQRSGSIDDNVVGFGIGAMANMLDADFRASRVERCKAYVALGFDGCAQSHKDHFYCTRDASDGICTPVQAWPLIAGDGLGGYASSGTTTPFIDLTGDDGLQPISGPMLQPDGTTPFAWGERARGERLIAEDLDDAGVPVFVYVNPYPYEGCPLDPTTWDDLANYNDTDCLNNYDDADGTHCETCSMRARALNADFILIDTGGKPLDSDNLGSGSGSGLSFAELRGILENFPSPDGTPPVVLGWISAPGFGTNNTKATPPKLCADPSETNPLTVAVCGNGTLEPGEECDDSDTTPGDGCDQHCRKPHAFVLAGQSNMEGRSTQNQDTDTGRVTSPDPFSSHVSRVFRARYLFDTGAGLPVWADANSWPCADSQCVDTWTGLGAPGVPGSCPARTAANNDAIDLQCKCHCGTSTDAWAGDLAELGSAWPTFAKRWMQDQGREVTFVSVNRGSSALVAFNDSDNLAGASSWDPTVNCTGRTWPTGSETPWKDDPGDLFCLVFHAVTQSGVGDSLKAVLWYQGEQDANEGISEAGYEAALNELVDQIWERLGVPTIIAPLSLRAYPLDAQSTLSSVSPTGVIRQAQLDVIASNPHAYRGPETNDLEHVDSVHIQDVITLGDRWAEASAHAIVGSKAYDGGQLSVCGNDHWERGETCDDGNTTAGDGCSATCTVEPGTRSFRMGFTPWAADFNPPTSDDETYTLIGAHADMVAHHFDNGVPWPEALADTAYHADVEAALSYRDGKLVGTNRYVAVSVLNTARDGIAAYWETDPNVALPSPWSGYDFGDPDVLTAYLQFCRRLIDDLGPTHFNYAVEANLLLENNPALWPDFLAFAEDVYTTLKAEYPDVWLFPSIHIGTIEGDRVAQEAAVTALLAFSDLVAVSTYPYLDAERSPGTGVYNDPADLPADYLSQVADLAPGKPFAIAETGFIAERLLLSSPALNIEGREDWQRDFVIWLLDQADALNAQFVTWFVIRDYDLTWRLLEPDVAAGFPESFKLFRDIGLADGPGELRRGMAVWDNWRARTFTSAAAVCGNNVLESGEACEDGNTSNGDGCSSTCTIEVAGITPAFTPSKLQGSTCVAPCAVHLDATATTAAGSARPFHDLDYTWDGGDPSAGTWETTGAAKNNPRGPVTGIILEDPGTYGVELTVATGAASETTAPQSVVVVDPFTAYGGSIYCVRSAATGDFLGCPLDTNADGACDAPYAANCFTQGNASTAWNDAPPNGANVDGARNSLYFRRGDTFTSAGSLSLNSGAGIGTIGAFGSGARPILQGLTNVVDVLGDGWTLFALRLEAAADTNDNGVDINARSNITMYDMVYAGGVGCGGITNSPTFNQLFGILGVQCLTSASASAGSNLFLRGEHYLVIGNLLDGNCNHEFNLRTTRAYKTAIQHNRMMRPGSTSSCNVVGGGTVRQNLAIRAWSTGPDGSNPAPAEDRYVVVSDNRFSASLNATTGGVIRTCLHNTCDNAAGAPEGNNDFLIERNLFQFDLGDDTVPAFNAGFVWAQGGGHTIRNNVADLRGIAAPLSMRFMNHVANGANCPSCYDDDHVVAGNVIYHEENIDRSVIFCGTDSSTSTGLACEGNLVYRPNEGSAVAGDTWTSGAGWSNAGNVWAISPSPFAATIPVAASTTLASFALDPASAARNTYTPTHPFILDALGNGRPASTSHDAGVVEQGATPYP
jgi:cysteine-rich repeat protein